MSVWIIEDTTDIREIMVHQTHRLGFEDIKEARTEEEAWALVHSCWLDAPPRFIVSDFYLADGNTKHLLFVLRELYPGCKIVCASSQLPIDIRDELDERGIQTYQKPINLRSVLA